MEKLIPAPTNRIAELRKRKGLTQAQLAEKVGVHWITISKLERGQIQFSFDWMNRLSEAMELDPDDFLPANRRLTTVQLQGEIMPGGVIEEYSESEGARSYTLWNGAFHGVDRVWYYVNSTALYPLFHDEDLLCFARNDSVPFNRFVNRFAMISGTYESGEHWQTFGYLHRTGKEDRYTISRPNEGPLTEVKVDYVFPLVSVFYNIPEIDEIVGDDD